MPRSAANSSLPFRTPVRRLGAHACRRLEHEGEAHLFREPARRLLRRQQRVRGHRQLRRAQRVFHQRLLAEQRRRAHRRAGNLESLAHHRELHHQHLVDAHHAVRLAVATLEQLHAEGERIDVGRVIDERDRRTQRRELLRRAPEDTQQSNSLELRERAHEAHHVVAGRGRGEDDVAEHVAASPWLPLGRKPSVAAELLELLERGHASWGSRARARGDSSCSRARGSRRARSFENASSRRARPSAHRRRRLPSPARFWNFSVRQSPREAGHGNQHHQGDPSHRRELYRYEVPHAPFARLASRARCLLASPDSPG